MGLLGKVVGMVADGVKDSSDLKRINELLPKMMNSPIADDFEAWFKAKLDEKPFLCAQYNYYDKCDRLVGVNDDAVIILFEIENANISEEVICNFANTLGYQPLSANGLSYSDGKIASERVLYKTFAEVVKERIKKVLSALSGEYNFGNIEFDDGVDKNASYMDQINQRTASWAFGGDMKLEQWAYFNYKVPKQASKSAF